MATPVPSKTPPSSAPLQPAAAKQPPKPSPAKPPATKLPSKLGLMKRTRLVAAGFRFVVYGPEGVGKTSLAADADPVFIDIEQSSKFIATRRYPFHPGEPDEYQPRTFDEVCAAVDDLADHPDPSIASVAIDTGDALEALIHGHLCKKNNVSSIEKVGGGFNKGYRAAVEVLREFQSKLDRLCAIGVHVIIVCHSQTTTFRDPEGEDYNRYTLKVHSSDKVSFAGQLKEWADVVGFLHFEGGSKKLDEDSERAIGWTTNVRHLEFQRSAAWDAKWRLLTPMPATIEIGIERPWSPIADAIVRERDTRPLPDRIRIELDRIGAEEFTTAAGTATSRTAVLAMLATADASTLSRVLNGLAATAAQGA